MTNVQPSTRTNNMILKGSEMINGDNIIIPIAINTLATTRSMIRKGMKIMNPIWNAVFNSLVTKEGTKVVKGTSSGDWTSFLPDIFTNSSISVSRVWASMKDLNDLPAWTTISH